MFMGQSNMAGRGVSASACPRAAPGPFRQAYSEAGAEAGESAADCAFSMDKALSRRQNARRVT